MRLGFCIEQLQNKRNCVKNRKCNKKCKDCNYQLTTEEFLEALEYALTVLENQKKIKKEFFDSGMEYAKTEFIRRLEREIKNVGDLHKAKTIDDIKYIQVLGLQKAIEITEEITNE